LNLPTKLDRTTLVVGGSFLCIGVLVLYVVASFWLMRSSYSNEIDRIESRTARLLGLVEAEQELGVAATRLRGHLQELAYADDTSTATVLAAMQQLIRDAMTDAGLSVSSSQILPIRQIDGFQRLSLDISVVGNIGEAEEAIASLALLRPLVLIESTNVKPVRTRKRRGAEAETQERDSRQISIRLRLLSLRLLP
jgi:general secretion pathway protein M